MHGQVREAVRLGARREARVGGEGKRRVELQAEAAELRSEQSRLAGSHDKVALRDHTERLRRHREELQAYELALARFHQEFGPLGDG